MDCVLFFRVHGAYSCTVPANERMVMAGFTVKEVLACMPRGCVRVEVCDFVALAFDLSMIKDQRKIFVAK